MNKKFLTTSVGFVVVLVGIVAFNIISSRVNFRVDVTDNNIYSLTDGTKDILGKLGDDITVKFYFSRSSKELPVPIKTFATRVEEVLQEYASLSDGHISIEVYDPKPDTDEEEWARKYKMQGVRLQSGNEFFFGAAFISGTKEIAISYFDPRREEFLEYDVSEAIVRTLSTKKKKIGVLSSLNIVSEAASPHMMPGQGPQDWVLVQQLKRLYDVAKIRPEAAEIPGDIDLLMVVHPKKLPDTALFAIDQYVIRGGRTIVMVDPFSRTDLARAQSMGMQAAMQMEASSDMPRLFKAWGVEFNKDHLVGDLKNMMQVNAGGAVVPYPFFVSLQSSGISTDAVMTNGLANLLLAEPGSLKKAKDAQVEFQRLIYTSKESGTAGATMVKFMGPADMAREIKQDEDEHVLASMVTGKFKSAFDQAPHIEGDEKNPAKPVSHVKEAKDKSTVVVIADVDFIADHNAVNKIQFGPQVILQPKNHNLNFVINAVEFLSGSEELISIRSRGKIARPFTKVQEIQAEAQKKWKEEEERLSQKLQEVQTKLNELQSERGSGSRFVLSAEQQSQIESFREEERKVRKRRREVRKNLREDIEKLGTRLVAFNMLTVPLGVGFFGMVVFVRRSRRTGRRGGRS